MYGRLFLLDFTLKILLKGLALVLEFDLFPLILASHLVYFLGVLFHLLYMMAFLPLRVFTGSLGPVGCSLPMIKNIRYYK